MPQTHHNTHTASSPSTTKQTKTNNNKNHMTTNSRCLLGLFPVFPPFGEMKKHTHSKCTRRFSIKKTLTFSKSTPAQPVFCFVLWLGCAVPAFPPGCTWLRTSLQACLCHIDTDKQTDRDTVQTQTKKKKVRHSSDTVADGRLPLKKKVT